MLASVLVGVCLAAPAASTSTADHARFEALEGPFATGPEVTAACLACHTEAAAQVQGSIHWTWEYVHPDTGQRLGKAHVLNSFCGNLRTNEPRCTSCHAGYGWGTEGFDPAVETNVDCLVCHDGTDTYRKFPTDAGHPNYVPRTFDGREWPVVDLAAVAQGVALPDRDNCGACHFFGGGGDGVKHGDLDSSLAAPAESLDVHMAEDGAGLRCSDCHRTTAHQWPGSRYDVRATDPEGRGGPMGRDDVATCESCHGTAPHDGATLTGWKLNHHTDRVACQTCHIPALARGGVPTKTWWDWSTAGQLGPDGKPKVEKDAQGRVTYDTRKGSFEWETDLVPEYRWFDGQVRYTELGDAIDPSGIVSINRIQGGPDDPDSRIWPFKVMRGKQAYDVQEKHLLFVHLYGKDDAAYWKNLDWKPAIERGMEGTGVSFSGQHGFVETEMVWPSTHMVAPADQALGCEDCHAEDGRLDQLAGFHLPGRDRPRGLDLLGLAAVGLTLAGVLGHGGMRLVSRGGGR